jgi:phospholipase D1/2
MRQSTAVAPRSYNDLTVSVKPNSIDASSGNRVLRPSKNVWRIERFSRAAVLIDPATYFGAVRAALLKAKRRVFIIGWDIHSRTRLVGPAGHADDGYPEDFGGFLSALVKSRPELEVNLLLWDFALLYAAEREPFPVYSLRWNTPRRVTLCLDDAVPIGSSHHQKLVVVDDAIAFSGGIDITVRRWDTSEHRIVQPLRCDPAGEPYGPFHDVQMLVDGDAAHALADLARARWQSAAREVIPPAEAGGDPWPEHVRPDFVDAEAGIARTQPLFERLEAVHEVQQLFCDSIGAAENTIYIENQFLSSIPLAAALARRLRERPQLEVVIITPASHTSWLEASSMRNGRVRFMQELQQHDIAERVRILSPEVRDGSRAMHVMVHSKVMIVDDRLLRVGSANLNNRSMGTDTECDIAIEARRADEREAIAAIRNRLISDHCGTRSETVVAALAKNPSLVALTDGLASNGHALRPIHDGPVNSNEWAAYMESIADPERPIGAEEFASTILDARVQRRGLSNLVKACLAGLVVLALVLAWHLTPLSDLARPETVRSTLEWVATVPWGPLAVLAIFVVSSVLLFPVTVLIAATAAAFGPWLGFAYAVAGSLISALVSFGIGALIGRQALTDVLGPRLNRISRSVRKRGVLAVAVVRLVPIAPFGVVNLVAGASHIRSLDFVLGTALGMLPGIFVLAAVGHQVIEVLMDPSLKSLLWLALALAAWITLSFGLQALVSKYWGDSS